MYYKIYYNSVIGELVIVSNEKSLVGIWLKNQKYYLGTLSEEPILNCEIEILVKTKKWLDRYFKGEKTEINELSLEPIGSEFRKRVWKILCEIPYGKTLTYGEIAKKIAKEMGKESISAQAVGNAVGHNPISIIIPCHRVVGANGNLTGFAGGIENKIKLLELEENDMSLFTHPRKGETNEYYRTKKYKYERIKK